MRILITNDDGIDSMGIHALVEAFSSPDNELYVSAPATQQSATSHSVSFFKDIQGQPRKLEGVKNAWAFWGTPADACYLGVKIAMKPFEPDLILSGINKGPNLSLDCIYSGTLAAAMEGTIMGYPSIAVSLDSYKATKIEEYRPAAQIAVQCAKMYLKDPENLKYTLNVNVPSTSLKEMKGFKMTEFDVRRSYQRELELIPQEDEMYLVHSNSFVCGVEPEEGNQTGDLNMVSKGFVSLTPIVNDWVDHPRNQTLGDWEKETITL